MSASLSDAVWRVFDGNGALFQLDATRRIIDVTAA